MINKVYCLSTDILLQLPYKYVATRMNAYNIHIYVLKSKHLQSYETMEAIHTRFPELSIKYYLSNKEVV